MYNVRIPVAGGDAISTAAKSRRAVSVQGQGWKTSAMLRGRARYPFWVLTSLAGLDLVWLMLLFCKPAVFWTCCDQSMLK